MAGPDWPQYENFLTGDCGVLPDIQQEIQGFITQSKKQGIKFIKDNLSPFNPKYNNILYSISVTRDKSGDTPSAYGKAEVKITLDGDKISNKYKITPVNASNIFQPKSSDYSKEEGWAEERIISNTPGYLSTEYIIDVEELDNYFWDLD
jgi:hypothetical protein